MKWLRLAALGLPLLLGCEDRRRADPRAVPEPAEPAGSAVVAPIAPTTEGAEIVLDRDAGVHGAAERQANVESANQFALALFRKLGSGNLVASGTSARFACGMAALGASGETAAEMAQALFIDPDPLRAAELARAERTDWAMISDSELTIANRLWLAAGFPIRPGYQSSVADAYDAPAESLDFAGAPSTSRRTINAWVSSKTKGHIPELLPEGTPNAASRADSWATGPARPVFRADHPFLFFLRDARTGRILFMGRVADPR